MADNLINTSSANSYGAINVAGSPEHGGAQSHPIIVLFREIRSGKQRIGPVLLFSLIAVTGACLNGFMLGFTAVLGINIKKHAYPNEVPQTMQFIGSIATIGALIAGLVAGYVSDRVGRKMSLLLASVPYAIGFMFIALSFSFIDFDGEKDALVLQPSILYLVFLLIGRALSGFGAGALSLVVPVYVVEIAPTSVRGLFGSLNQLSVTVGILIIYFLNTFLPYYITSLVVQGITLLFTLGVALLIPRSPRWLVANNRELDANAVLINLRGPQADVRKEMVTLKKNVESQMEYTIWDKLNMFRRQYVIIPLVLSIVLMFFQQFCGINVVIFYAGTVLESADVSNPDLSADFGVGIIQVIATFVSVILVDILGRKILLSAGGILLALSTGGLGVYFFLHDNVCKHYDQGKWFCSPHFGYFAVACLAVFIIGFSIGWGPIPWLMMTELAPLHVRGIMGGIATAINWAFAAIITSLFNDYEHLVHTYGAWWTFCAISALSVVFTLVFLPETKGMDLEDIEEFFMHHYRPCGKAVSSEDGATNSGGRAINSGGAIRGTSEISGGDYD